MNGARGLPQVGLSLPNRGVFFGAITFEQMVEMAETVDRSPYFHSVWAGDSVIAKPRHRKTARGGCGALRAGCLNAQGQAWSACMASFSLRHPDHFCCPMGNARYAFGGGRSLLTVCVGGPTGPGSGAGAFEVELRAMGLSLEERVSRMEGYCHSPQALVRRSCHFQRALLSISECFH